MDNETPDPEVSSSPVSDQESKTNNENLIVVGVGASAGGLEAFNELLKHLPPTTGMAFVLIQHLDPRHESLLSELLASKTPMPVLQVEHRMRLQPDHVYVIPPNTTIRAKDGLLLLDERPALQEPFRPIDIFFISWPKNFTSMQWELSCPGPPRTAPWA